MLILFSNSIYLLSKMVENDNLYIFHILAGLKFKEVQKPQVWHPEVCLYAVSDTETGERMGYFYLDLYPR